MTSQNPFIALKEEMDKLVIGHEEVKISLLLGIIAREHIYVEGPPGTAKTMLAEIISGAAQLKFFFYQLHRDTRLSELLGDLVISKEISDAGEVIKQKVVKGGILTAEICLLDDISRAPGESLNVLLRILNERKFFDEEIPLLTAIATSNPTADEYYNEPLDPANLDRHAFLRRTEDSRARRRNKFRSAAHMVGMMVRQQYRVQMQTLGAEQAQHRIRHAGIDNCDSLWVGMTAQQPDVIVLERGDGRNFKHAGTIGRRSPDVNSRTR